MEFIPDVNALDQIFLRREHRKLRRGTISLGKELYEVPGEFIGKRVDVRIGEKGVHIYENGAPVAEAKVDRLKDNAHGKRNSSPFTSISNERGVDSDV